LVSPAAATKRLALLAVVPALFAAGSAAAATERGLGLEVTAPSKAVQGSFVTISVAARPAGVSCSLSLRYRTGSHQKGLGLRRANGGHAQWHFRIARRAPTGPARATVSCGRAGRHSWTLMIVGSVIPAKIHVVNKGFSQRALTYGGSWLSWGVILANDSPNQDALDVTVLANFVMPDNRLIGSATVHVSRIAAGSTHAMGGELTFPGLPPIARVEVSVTIGSRGPAQKTKPAMANIRVVPDPYDPAWVGSVEGEIQNTHARRSLQSSEISTAVLDGAGNVIGGGTGYAFAALPPGAREFIKISGMHAVAMGQAASAVVSIVPTYK
jgi:hypothetical protein